MVMLMVEMMMLALVSPNTMVIALPNIGMKAKKPIQAPRPAMNLSAWSSFSFFTCRYFSIHSIFPSLPTP